MPISPEDIQAAMRKEVSQLINAIDDAFKGVLLDRTRADVRDALKAGLETSVIEMAAAIEAVAERKALDRFAQLQSTVAKAPDLGEKEAQLERPTLHSDMLALIAGVERVAVTLEKQNELREKESGLVRELLEEAIHDLVEERLGNTAEPESTPEPEPESETASEPPGPLKFTLDRDEVEKVLAIQKALAAMERPATDEQIVTRALDIGLNTLEGLPKLMHRCI
jgi:hypothetical protein